MNNSPRILFLTSSFPVPGYPASGTFIYQLAKHLNQRCSINVLAPDGDKSKGNLPHDSENNLPVALFRYAPRRLQVLFHRPGGLPETIRSRKWMIIMLPLALISMALHILKFSRNSDLIHANWSLTAVIALLVKTITRKPVIVTFRGSDISLAGKNTIAKLLVQICIKNCVHVICVNKALQKILIDLYKCPPNKVSVIPNGVSDNFTDLPLKKKFSSPVKFIFVGNLTKNKSVDVILKALADLNDSDFQLTIIGSGPDEQYLKNLSVRLNIHKKVSFLGQCSPDNIPQLLQDSDIFLFSSKNEGRPNVLLEAMAAGKTIVASDIPGVSDLISDKVTGLLYPYESTEILSSKISELINDQEFASQLGLQARKYISDSGLSWSQCAKQYLSLYKQIASHSALKNEL
jgi:glycosyltransferase involved in cell wall biosynthesis